jgi:AIPR protein
MQRLRDEPLPTLDTDWYKRLIAIAVLYRSVEKNIRLAKFPAYGAQIIAYLVSGLSCRNNGYINSQQLWSAQATSSEMNGLIQEWAPKINSALRESAGQLNPSEWFKKEQCWEAIKTGLPILRGTRPPELALNE